MRVAVPGGWQPGALTAPDLAQTPQVTLVDWQAWGPPAALAGPAVDGGAADAAPACLVMACFETPLDTWTPEAEPIVLDKIAQSATSAALRVTPDGALHGTLVTRHGLVLSQELEGPRGAGRTFLGFTPGKLTGCFAVCIDGPSRACAGSVAGATAEGDFAPAPEASASLRVVLGAVHHPQIAAGTLLTLAIFAGTTAILTRRRPGRR